MTISWAIDPGGDIRPVALDVADAIAKRVAAEVNSTARDESKVVDAPAIDV